MTHDPDIRRGATRMIEHYGPKAAAAAKARAADLLRAGEASAAEIWREIALAIETNEIATSVASAIGGRHS